MSSQRNAILEAAGRWMTRPSIVRRGDARIVVGHDIDEPRRWTALRFVKIDVRGVWWSDHSVGFHIRGAAIEAAHNN
ncbi:MAG: hypothetical protein KDE27_11370 [Planctomycetes bacterium]|nr:hypothetical protein [Planctomycetota bacterium]